MDRRTFLRAAALGGAGTALALRAADAPAALPDYRALVCVFLYGGNDSFNMVAPRSPAEYGVYAASRQNLAIGQADLLPVTVLNPDGALYGFHPAMRETARLFEAGRLAVVANVGPLIEPATRDQVLAGAVALPPQLFSHIDQQDQWQTLKGRAQLTTGWAGRIADALAADTAGQGLPVGISLAGTNGFQTGVNATPYTVGTGGAPTYFVLTDPTAGFYAERRAMFESLLDAQTTSPLQRSLAAVHRRSLATADRVNAALLGAPVLATTFPSTELAAQLNEVARLIAVRDTLAMRRQVFFVAQFGFDTHDGQLLQQPQLLGDLSAALGAFDAALQELGVADSVVTFTQSDFGRTLTSNGDGTDHGWGSHHLVMGSAVHGRTIYGQMPRLELGGPDDLGAGRIVPGIAVDQYAGTLARWFGVAAPDLPAIAPQLGNFAVADLGFV